MKDKVALAAVERREGIHQAYGCIFDNILGIIRIGIKSPRVNRTFIKISTFFGAQKTVAWPLKNVDQRGRILFNPNVITHQLRKTKIARVSY